MTLSKKLSLLSGLFRFFFRVSCLCLSPVIALPARAESPRITNPVHVVYGTDLFHPHDDPDDHYDLATLFAIPDLQVEAVLLDLGERQKVRPGNIPLEQVFSITGKKVPYATGLSGPLLSADDKGLDRTADEQKAIELLLETLRKSKTAVTIITAGSVRDVCAAFNREPELFRAKVNRLYINIGSAVNTLEWNVQLDRHAFLGIMHSGLPLYWNPCQPQPPHPHTTFWKFQQGKMFEGLPLPVLNYFVYALQRVRPDELDPQSAIRSDLRIWRQLPGRDERNMWCTASILDAAGLHPERSQGSYRPARRPAELVNPVYQFVPVAVELDEQGLTQSIREDEKGTIRLFTTSDNGRYQAAMTDCLRGLLIDLGARSVLR